MLRLGWCVGQWSFALVNTVVVGRGSLQATLLSLGTARDAVGAREVGDTRVKGSEQSGHEVRNQGKRCHICGSHVHQPSIRMDEKACAVFARVVQATRSHELRVRKYITHRGEGAHVEVTTDEVNVVLHHKGV